MADRSVYVFSTWCEAAFFLTRGSLSLRAIGSITLAFISSHLLAGLLFAQAAQVQPIPHLAQQHGASQIVVDGKPFLARAGELENSSASSQAYMDTVWPKVAAMHFNTVLAPAYWRLIQPKEGSFDFTTVDALIQGARQHKVKVVLLWFGSWKNSMSCYVPDWVKEDEQRFPRAQSADGSGLEILSALSANNLEADSRAFATLMNHLREIDAADRTVIMVQVENEVGMIPEARDLSPTANAAYMSAVPRELTDYLAKHRETLQPKLRQAWEAHGAKAGANWPETFGPGVATDELFTAWTEGRFTGEVAARGKAIDPLPMFVNAALIRPGRLPGQYPSGGPLPHLFDIWRAATPEIDWFSPDLYFPNFAEWASQYVRPGNPLFIPESGRVNASEMSANALYAYGQLNAMGFSVYAPEFLKAEEERILGDAYSVIDQLSPLILENQGTGRMRGIRPPAAFDGSVDLTQQQFTLGNYSFTVHFKEPGSASIGANVEPELPGAHGGLVIQLDQDEFLVAGTGMIITFATHGLTDPIAGIDSIWEGSFVNGVWTPGREMNGDADNQGRSLRVPSGNFAIFRVHLYHYR